MKLKHDDVIFCCGAIVVVIMCFAKVEVQLVLSVMGYFGYHKGVSVIDDKTQDKIDKV